MTLFSTATRCRKSLTLDPRMPFDALIVNRLERLPDARQHEWLHGLLVQGFLYECRQLRELEGEGAARQPAPPARASVHRVPAIDTGSAAAAASTPSRPAVSAIDKRCADGAISLAMLRKVIG